MRVYWFSFRTIWAALVGSLRRCRKIWLLVFLSLLAGATLGALTAALVEEPTPRSVLGSILADTYHPFAVFGLCLLCLSACILVVYVSARFTRRYLFFACILIVGYLLGRLATFAALCGVVGVVSLLLCEIPFCLLSVGFGTGYFCSMCDVLLTTLRPRPHKRYVMDGVRYWLAGTVCLFAAVVVVWGLVSALVNVSV